jgi:hypothetical protein
LVELWKSNQLSVIGNQSNGEQITAIRKRLVAGLTALVREQHDRGPSVGMTAKNPGKAGPPEGGRYTGRKTRTLKTAGCGTQLPGDAVDQAEAD